MGTNYFLHTKNPDNCEVTERDTSLHIGKSSAGWCFSLHVDPSEGIQDLPDWVERWSKEDSYIMNENGERVTPAEMLGIICNRKSNDGKPFNESYKPTPFMRYASAAEFHRKNYSMEGPHGLLRHAGPHCVKNGDGTWDCIIGTFR